MNNQQTRKSVKKNNGSTDQLMSGNSDFGSLTDREVKLTDNDLEITDKNLEEVVGGFVGFFTPHA